MYVQNDPLDKLCYTCSSELKLKNSLPAKIFIELVTFFARDLEQNFSFLSFITPRMPGYEVLHLQDGEEKKKHGKRTR